MLIIFDLDDTLVDTTNSLTPFQLKLALKEMVRAGLEISSFSDELKKLYQIDLASSSAKETLKKFLHTKDPDGTFFEIGMLKMYYDIPANFQINPLPNAKKVLTFLSKNHDLAIVSTGEEKTQILKLEKAGIEPSFFCRIDVAKAAEKKPFYRAILKEKGYTSKNVLMCGDKIDVDLIPAKELGMTTVHILWGRGKRQIAGKQWVDYTITDLPELLKIVEEL